MNPVQTQVRILDGIVDSLLRTHQPPGKYNVTYACECSKTWSNRDTIPNGVVSCPNCWLVCEPVKAEPIETQKIKIRHAAE